MLAVVPTVFFLPKFFELQTVSKTFKVANHYNCSMFDTDSISSDMLAMLADENNLESSHDADTLKTMIPKSLIENIQDEEEAVCNRIVYTICTRSNLTELYQVCNLMTVLHTVDEIHDSEFANTLSLKDVATEVYYNVSTHIASMMNEQTVEILDQTEMRKNPLYYKIYNLGLVTLFAQIIPVGILMYFNINICMALKNAGGGVIDAQIKSQRQARLKMPHTTGQR